MIGVAFSVVALVCIVTALELESLREWLLFNLLLQAILWFSVGLAMVLR